MKIHLAIQQLFLRKRLKERYDLMEFEKSEMWKFQDAMNALAEGVNLSTPRYTTGIPRETLLAVLQAVIQKRVKLSNRGRFRGDLTYGCLWFRLNDEGATYRMTLEWDWERSHPHEEFSTGLAVLVEEFEMELLEVIESVPRENLVKMMRILVSRHFGRFPKYAILTFTPTPGSENTHFELKVIRSKESLFQVV